MKKYIFYFTVGVILFVASAYSQGFWDISPGLMDYAQSDNDTTAANLKSIIRSHPGFEYYGPLKLLAYFHGTTERSFILDSIRLYAYQDTAHGRNLSRYYSYQLARGYLGDPGAFAGLDTCALLMNWNSCADDRLYSIQLLAEHGYYNHFDIVQTAVPQNNLTLYAIYCLGAYAQSPQYRDQCKTLLASVINDPTQAGGEVSLAAEKLAIFDKPSTSSLLMSRFTSSDISVKHLIYSSVENVDQDLQIEMSKIVLSTEPATSSNKSDFVPGYYSIIKDTSDHGGFVPYLSKKFLKPSYIKFVKDFMAQQPPQDSKGVMRWFLDDFLPAPETTSVLNMLDTLISTEHEIAGYNWVSDGNFVNYLDSLLTNARNHLTSGDSNNCARQIKVFQQRVDEEYRDSLDGDTRTINLEGWKFLYYNAQYILARLPAVPTQYLLTISTNGHGTISRSPSSSSYDSASNVQLTAVPDTGYRLPTWGGDTISTVNPLTIKMTHDKNITATFVVAIDTIIATSGTDGTISPIGIVPVPYDSSTTFAIVPNTGYRIDSVLVDGISQDAIASYTFTHVKSNHTITAKFVVDHYLTVPAGFASIQSAINFARHGDTVAVSPGTYNESITIAAKDSLIVLAAGAVDQVSVKGFIITGSSSITVKGFVVDASGTGVYGVDLSQSSGATSRIILEANQIKNSSSSGIRIYSPGTLIRIVNNRIHSNSRNGIEMKSPSGTSSSVYVINNTITKNGYNGITSAAEDYIYLVNNIVAFNGTASGTTGGRYGVWRDTPLTGQTGPIKPNTPTPAPHPVYIRMINNVIIGNNGTVSTIEPKCSKDLRNYSQILDAEDSGNMTTAGNEGTGISGSSNATFSATFVSASPIDLHLKSGSVAINRGVNSWNAPDATTGAIPAKDFEGTTRPQGASVDCGADEY